MEDKKLDLNYNLLNDQELQEFTQELSLLSMLPMRLYINRKFLENSLMTNAVTYLENDEIKDTGFLQITFAYPIESSNVIILTDEEVDDKIIEIITKKAIDFMKLTSLEDLYETNLYDDDFIN